MGNQISIFSDGGARGNPGPASCAFVVQKGDEILYKESRYLGETTNNFAEYQGVILALNWVVENKGIFMEQDKTVFYLDSELVVKQINGFYKVKEATLQMLYKQVKNLLSRIPLKISFVHVLRNKNKISDGLVNEELDNNFRR